LNCTSEFKNLFAAAFLAASLLFSLRPITAQQPTGCGSGNQGGPRANSAENATSGSAAQDQSPPPKGPGSPNQGGPRAAPIHPLPSNMGSARVGSQSAASSRSQAAGLVLRDIWSEPFPEEFAASHIDDQYVGIDDRGQILTKRQFVESRQTQHGFYLHDVKLHGYENVSVLIGILKGPAESYRYTAVLVEDYGGWKLVASQLTRIPQ